MSGKREEIAADTSFFEKSIVAQTASQIRRRIEGFEEKELGDTEEDSLVKATIIFETQVQKKVQECRSLNIEIPILYQKWSKITLVAYKGRTQATLADGEFTVQTIRRGYWKAVVRHIGKEGTICPLLNSSGILPLKPVSINATEAACVLAGVIQGVVDEHDTKNSLNWSFIFGLVVGVSTLGSAKGDKKQEDNRELIFNIITRRFRGVPLTNYNATEAERGVKYPKRKAGGAGSPVDLTMFKQLVNKRDSMFE